MTAQLNDFGNDSSEIDERRGPRLLAAEPGQIADDFAKLTIYRAFIEGALDVPRHLARDVHKQYFEPQYEEFAPRTMFSLSNAFTTAFKELDPIPYFKATAKLGAFFNEN